MSAMLYELYCSGLCDRFPYIGNKMVIFFVCFCSIADLQSLFSSQQGKGQQVSLFLLKVRSECKRTIQFGEE